MTLLEILNEELTEGQRIPKLEDQKLWPDLALNQILLKGEGLNETLKLEHV